MNTAPATIFDVTSNDKALGISLNAHKLSIDGIAIGCFQVGFTSTYTSNALGIQKGDILLACNGVPLLGDKVLDDGERSNESLDLAADLLLQAPPPRRIRVMRLARPTGDADGIATLVLTPEEETVMHEFRTPKKADAKPSTGSGSGGSGSGSGRRGKLSPAELLTVGNIIKKFNTNKLVLGDITKQRLDVHMALPTKDVVPAQPTATAPAAAAAPAAAVPAAAAPAAVQPQTMSASTPKRSPVPVMDDFKDTDTKPAMQVGALSRPPS